MAAAKGKGFFSVLRKGGDRKSKNKSASEPDEVMNIGTPTNVKHEVHVGFDSKTGEFVGLPPVWGAWLEQSKIGVEEQKQNPNAVINALKTYEHSVRHMKDKKYMGGDSMEDINDSGGESGIYLKSCNLNLFELFVPVLIPHLQFFRQITGIQHD